MKLSELRLEIKEGDVINGQHVAEKFSMSYAYCGDRKFMIVSGGSRYAEKINTVSRAGEIYFRRRRRGGANNVHRRGGKQA